jgi:outer membrane lipoprotein SlyB
MSELQPTVPFGKRFRVTSEFDKVGSLCWGEIKVAESTKGEDAAKIGVGAVGGAIVGGILGGGSGAAQGAVIGGAAGTGVVLATRGEEVTLVKGTVLAASLASPLTVRVPAR